MCTLFYNTKHQRTNSLTSHSFIEQIIIDVYKLVDIACMYMRINRHYFRYLEDLALKTDKKQDPIIRVAIFGIGRAGTIHMSNIVRNPRMKIVYVVDDLEEKWNDLKNYWRLENAVILNSKQAERIFKDPKYNEHYVFVNKCISDFYRF